MFLDCSPFVLGPAISEFKRCPKCGEYKSHDQFTKQKGLPGGLRSHCKACRAKDSHRYHAANLDKDRERHQRWVAENPNKGREYTSRWRAKNLEKVREYAAQYRVENHDKIREYGIRYRAENPDKIQERRRRYVTKHPNGPRESSRRYRAENMEKVRESNRQYRVDNRAELQERRRQRYAENPWIREYGRRWRAQNIVKERERRRRYATENPEAIRASSHRRLARKRGLPNTFTASDIAFAFEAFNHCCAVCERQLNGLFHSDHLDHWMPLVSPDCPGTVPHNMVPLCSDCNLSKGGKHPAEWLIGKFGKRKGRAILRKIEAFLESRNLTSPGT